MKIKSLIAISALALAATTAGAFEVTKSIKIDNTIETFYSTEKSEFIGTYEIKPMLSIAPKTSLFMETKGNLINPSYQGFDVGVEYQLQTGLKLTESYLQTKAVYDKNGTYKGVLIGGKFKF